MFQVRNFVSLRFAHIMILLRIVNKTLHRFFCVQIKTHWKLELKF